MLHSMIVDGKNVHLKNLWFVSMEGMFLELGVEYAVIDVGIMLQKCFLLLCYYIEPLIWVSPDSSSYSRSNVILGRF